VKRESGVLRLHMGCGEALTSRVAVLRLLCGDQQHGRMKPARRKAGKDKR
jgi:hypothetical protein